MVDVNGEDLLALTREVSQLVKLFDVYVLSTNSRIEKLEMANEVNVAYIKKLRFALEEHFPESTWQ